jgi:hypothetical protein
MWTMIKEAYGRSAWIALSLPLLIALPTIAEMAQHAIEYRLGIFDSVESMQRMAADPGRMAYGMVKVLTLFLLLYWVSRAMAFGRGGGRRVLGDGRSAFLFLWVVLLSLLLVGVGLFGDDLLGSFVDEPKTRFRIMLLLFAAGSTLHIYLMVWMVGAALGNGPLNIPASFRIMKGNFWWSAVFFLIAQLPLMAAHFGLNFAAVGRPAPVMWALLALDALLVGFLGIVLAASQYLIARRATERAGVRLT